MRVALITHLRQLRSSQRVASEIGASRCSASRVSGRAVSSGRRHISVKGESSEWLKPGGSRSGFVVERVTDSIPARGLGPLAVLHHPESGARWLHVGSDADDNNVFCIALRTVPQDSTGVAHVLEHTVLCGSEKYPVRDPFFNMIKRSVSTYMNAWTGSDFTAYPFSSCNERDFENLTRVYTDAVFFPRLDEWDFLQEGHRLEVKAAAGGSSGDDGAGSPVLGRTGVVYNEMKGAMSDGSALFSQRVSSELFEGTTYEHNSGGSPSDIPDLTHDALVAFHKKHYHPSNAWFITYGNLPLERHLENVNDLVLSRFAVSTDGDSSVHTVVGKKEPTGQPKRVVDEGGFPSNPLSPSPDKQTKVSITWRVNDIGADSFNEGVEIAEQSTFTTFALSVLSSLLGGGPNSPMYKALIESQIGSGYAPGTGYEPFARQATFGYGLSDIHPDDSVRVEKLVMDALQKAAEEGFSQDRIDAVLQQLEIGIRSQSSNFGLAIVQAVIIPLIHQADPVEHLQEQRHVDRLRQELDSNPRFFQDLIREHLLNNEERLTLIMSPSETYMQDLLIAEDNKLSNIAKSLSTEDFRRIEERSTELEARQALPQDPSSLPMLNVNEDIPRTVSRIIPVAEDNGGTPGARTFWVDQPTNDLVYFRGLAAAPGNLEIHAAGLNLPGPTQFIRDMSLVSLIPLWQSLIGALPTRRRTYQDLSQQLERYTGGVSVGLKVLTDPNDFTKSQAHIKVSGTAQHTLTEHLGDLMAEILEETIFVDQAAKDVIRIQAAHSAASFADSIVSGGHGFAVSRASRWLSPNHWLNEQFSGVSGLQFSQQLAQEMSDPAVGDLVVDAVAERLQLLHSLMTSSKLQRSLITSPSQHFQRAGEIVEKTAAAFGGWNEEDAAIPAGNPVLRNAIEFGDAPVANSQECIVIPGEVSFAAKAMPLVPFHHPDRVALGLASRMMSWCFLHREVREKGGAYGSGCNADGGTLTMHSYRDPAPLTTLKTFDKLESWMRTQDGPKPSDLADAKISLFGALDSPQAPPHRGVEWWSSGSTPEIADENRERAFNLSFDDVLEAVDRHVTGQKLADAHQCVVASENKREEFAASGWSFIE